MQHVNKDWPALVGDTPLVRLERLLPGTKFNLYAKLEMNNPGGSMKDRAALSIIRSALQSGKIKKGGTVIESSSGNMGIGLAQACSFFGLHCICVTDQRANKQAVRLMEAYGAKVEIVQSAHDSLNLLQERLDTVNKLLATIPGSYWPNQYANHHNALGYHGLMQELDAALKGKIDWLVCATGTCGTIRGCADYIKQKQLPTKIIAVDAIGSVIFGGTKGKRLIPGHGAALRPELFREGMAAVVQHVSDTDCVRGCMRLLETESILAGGSTGGIVTALGREAQRISDGNNVVVIVGDRGERYLDTIYNYDWVTAHLEDYRR